MLADSERVGIKKGSGRGVFSVSDGPLGRSGGELGDKAALGSLPSRLDREI